MSDENTKVKHSKRLHDSEIHVNKQVKIAKTHGVPIDTPHRYDKNHVMNCGNPKCVMCGNPRKVWKENTMQEKKFIQTEKWGLDD
jgi:hypothetical protein